MQKQLNPSQIRDVWSWTLSSYCHCWADAEGNRPCDNGTLCDRCSCDDVKAVYEAEIRRLERELRPIEPGDSIQAMGLTFKVDRVSYQESWAEKFDGRLEVWHDVEFFDPDGGYHSWKSWIDGGSIIRK